MVIAPGNHDWLSAASPYRQPIWPENVRIFLGRGMERLTLPELGCTVYGAAFTAPEEAESGLAGFYAQPDGNARIMVLHGDVGSREAATAPSPRRRSLPRAWTIWPWAMSTPLGHEPGREHRVGLSRLSPGPGL